MLDNLKQDLVRINYYRLLQPKQVGLGHVVFEALRNAGYRAVVFYRVGRWFRCRKMGFCAAVVERFMRHLCHCWISTAVDIGPGFVIAHVCGIIIDGIVGPIGKNFTIRQNVTIGGNYGKSRNGRMQPIIGDDVSVGPGASILGPVSIGSNTIIGANAVVTTDIPENSVAGAFRAEVVAKRACDGGIIHEKDRVFVSRRELYERMRLLEEKIEKLEQIATSER
jgi:serine O-acetyltransferase